MAERDYLGGATNTVVHWESDGSAIIEEKQDCQAILDSNARGRNERFDSWSPEGTVREEFTIPFVVAHKMELDSGLKMGSPEFDVYMDKRLRDPDLAYLISAPKVRDPHIIIRGAR